MKKLVVFLIISAVAAGGVYAQSETESSEFKNTFYGGFGGGFGMPFLAHGEIFASYEYAIIPQLAVGANISMQMYPMAIAWMIGEAVVHAKDQNKKEIKSFYSYIIEGQLHWYPAGNTFHLDLGLGYSNYVLSMHTFLIAPGIGWRLDFAEPGGFIMNIGLRVEYFQPISKSAFVIDADNANGYKSKDIVPVNFLSFRLGFGYRF